MERPKVARAERQKHREFMCGDQIKAAPLKNRGRTMPKRPSEPRREQGAGARLRAMPCHKDTAEIPVQVREAPR